VIPRLLDEGDVALHGGETLLLGQQINVSART
jgi:hypothetical protein